MKDYKEIKAHVEVSTERHKGKKWFIFSCSNCGFEFDRSRHWWDQESANIPLECPKCKATVED